MGRELKKSQLFHNGEIRGITSDNVKREWQKNQKLKKKQEMGMTKKKVVGERE